MPPPGRFRSKTADLSDFIRGSSSKQSSESHLATGAAQATPPPPPVPQIPDKAAPTKTRRKLTFLSRSRKSGSVSPSPSSSSQKSGEHTGIPAPSQVVPPLPDISSRHTSESTARSPDRISTSLPPVLPPPNVSPPSFGSLAQFSQGSKTNVLDVSSTPPSRLSNPSVMKTLRTHRSTSFELSSRHLTSQSRGSSGGGPVITVSPPRGVKDSPDSSVQQLAPSASSWRSPRSLRRPAILSFSGKKEEQTKVARSPPSPTMSVATPPLPPSMQFPIPPNSQVSTPLAKSMKEDARPRRETMNSGKSISMMSPTSATFSEISRRASRAPSQTSRESKDQADQLSPTSALRLVDELPPAPRTPSRLAINTTGHACVGRQESLKSPMSATHTRFSFRRGSRSPSPAGTPPTAPLPSLPPEAHEHPPPPPPAPKRLSMPPPPAYILSHGHAPASSQLLATVTTVPTIPSMPSVSSSRSVTPLRQQVLRPRANTIPTTPTFAVSNTPSPTLSPIPETGKLNLKDSEKRTELAEILPGLAGSKTKERESTEGTDRRGSVSTTTSTTTTTSPHTELNTPPRKVTDSPLYGDVMSLRATHEEYVQSIRETHAMEKAELQRRIEQLEREARKRDREIKGLRWLVMNANNGAGVSASLGGPNAKSAVSLSTAETEGRYRSGSKSSQFSQLSTASSGINVHRRDTTETTPAFSSFQSPRTSTEEGLFELQTTIADLISPAIPTPPLGVTLRAQAQSPIPLASPTSGQAASPASVATRLRRANTLPDGVSPLPAVTKTSPAYTSRSARRTSSPILPPNSPPSVTSRTSAPTISGAGLGFHIIDIPSIPTSSSLLSYNRLSTTDTTLSTVSTIPSLSSNVSTASSSALSAIPETLNPAVPEPVTRDKQKEERDARRASRVLKRLSASSSTASVGAASAAYQQNLKLGQTPSIEQMLDHSAEASMDDVLKKLRAFGASGDH